MNNLERLVTFNLGRGPSHAIEYHTACITRVATVTVTIYLDTPAAGVSFWVGQEKDPPLTNER